MILFFFKLIIIGVVNIIFGVFGGILVVMLNVYDFIIEKIGNFFLVDRKIKVFYFFYLFVVFVGVVIGIFFFVNIIKYFIINYFRIIVIVFILFILLFIFYIVKGLDYKKKKNILVFCYGVIIMIFFIFLGLKYGDKIIGVVII